MEKKISAYKSNTAEFLSFVDTMNKWRAKNADELIRQCRKADTDNSGSLEYDIVKLSKALFSEKFTRYFDNSLVAK